MHEQLRQLVDDRIISAQKHRDYDLWIYNYTQKAQFAHHWTPETLMCRGLVLDGAGQIVSRPFPKFFNLEENGPEWQIPGGGFKVTQKLDGSLGIMYPTPDGPQIATRGSFYSDQALHATAVFRERYSQLAWEPDRYTYLFEIIFPQNRIVVDYGSLNDLVLLAVIETSTGKEVELPDWFPNHVTRYDGITDISSLKSLSKDNEEGFVVTFDSGERVKVKFDEYVRLHRLVTGVTARTIWELMMNGQSIDDLLSRVPEEFEHWVRETEEKLQSQYDELDLRANEIWAQVSALATRKDQATHSLMVNNRDLGAIVFAMLDHKPYAPIIWKMIKPAHEQPFKEADA